MKHRSTTRIVRHLLIFIICLLCLGGLERAGLSEDGGATPTPKPTLGPWPTLSPTSTPKSAAAPEPEIGDWVAYLLIGGIVVVAAGIVVLAIMARKKR